MTRPYRNCTRISIHPIIYLIIVAVFAGSFVGCERGAQKNSSLSSSSTDRVNENNDQESARINASERPVVEQESPLTYPGTDAQQALLARAKSAFLSNDVYGAEDYFKELVATEPLSAAKISGMLALGQIYVETNRASVAIDLYDNFLEQQETDIPEVYLVLARTYAQLEQMQRSHNAYLKVLEIQPRFIFAYAELGALLAHSDKLEESGQYFLKYEQELEQFVQILAHEQSSVEDRLQVLDIFSMIDDERTIEATINALDDPVASVRAHAARVLGEINAVIAKDALEKMYINDRDATVRASAQQALARLKE